MEPCGGTIGIVAVGVALLGAILILIVAAFAWQGVRRRRDLGAVYVVDDAVRFILPRLSAGARQRLEPAGVRRLLEWQLEWQQVEAPRAGQHAVVGCGDALEHVHARAVGFGMEVEAGDVAEVVAADVEYLLAIGAVGAPAGEGEQ